MKDKCINCPLLNKKDVPCWAVEEGHGVACSKIDKNSNKFNPKYIKFILEKSGVNTSLPGVLEQVSNLAESTADYIKDGFIKATQAEQKRRMEICQSCEMYEQGRCKSCGCFLETKVSWRVSTCPLELWGVEEQVNLPPPQINTGPGVDCGCKK